MIKEICGVGPSGAGKDVVMERVQDLLGIPYISLSTYVREAAAEAGLVNATRLQLQNFANSLRESEGEDVFARKALQHLDNNQVDGDWIIINGVRNLAELRAFRQPLIIGVDSSKETRFGRVIERNRPSDPKTWEEFCECDIKENGTLNGTTGQQNYQCLSAADLVIHNEGSLSNLEYAVDRVVDDIVNKSFSSIQQHITIDNQTIDKKSLVILNGPQGSGKSSVAKQISSLTGIEYLDEIGAKLRAQSPDTCLDSTESFDREVMRQELLRDGNILRNGDALTYLVETWHPGNLAYSMERSPGLIPVYLKEYKKQIEKFQTLHILLLINDDNFRKRIKEKVSPEKYDDLLEFYKSITQNIQNIYQQNKISPLQVENNEFFEKTVNTIMDYMNNTLDN
jgi:dephospho-CoA kinase